jgi:hypothetical protein
MVESKTRNYTELAPSMQAVFSTIALILSFASHKQAAKKAAFAQSAVQDS